MTWTKFLASLGTGISVFETRVQSLSDAVTSDGEPAIVYEPGRVGAGPNDCLVAVGRHWTRLGDEPQPVDHAGICFNDKGLDRPGRAGRAGGITALAHDPPDEILGGWSRLVGQDAPPRRFFQRFTLVVEDASPDSCFGLIALLARLNGLGADEIPSEWVDDVVMWEWGASRVADPFRA